MVGFGIKVGEGSKGALILYAYQGALIGREESD